MSYPRKIMHSTEKTAGAAAMQKRHEDLLDRASTSFFTVVPRILRAMKHVHRTETVDAERELGESQVGVMHALAKKGELLTSELARHFNVTNPTMTRIVDGLVDKGYVQRQPDVEDRRCIYLRLTEKGSEIEQQVQQHYAKALSGFLTPLSDKQLADIVRAFDHLNSLVPDRVQDNQGAH